LSHLRQIFSEFVRLEIELWNAVDARLRSELDLPLTQFEPMSIIDRVRSCRVYDIASELVITTGGASKLVDRIEENGYCRRRANPSDRRSSVLELTPAGRRLLARACVMVDDELQRRVGDVVPERTLQQLATIMARLRAAGHRLDLEERPA
jgi:MarR family transcriptional regulator, organic hydroperoxide resistance regulator